MLVLGSKPRILITRLSAIGDGVHCVPMLNALRKRFPDAFLAWAGQPPIAALLKDHPSLDQFIVVERNWLKQVSTIRRLRSELRSYAFDVAIDPQSLTKSSLLGWMSGARHRIGFSRGQARELSPWLSNCRVTPDQRHVVNRYLELLEPLGISITDPDFYLPVATAATRAIQRFLSQNELREFALLNPGAGWNSKLWPHDRYAAVAEHLACQHGISSVVLWAGDRERKWAEDIAIRSSAILAPATTLSELAAMCQQASLFVGSDTGPLHLAAAVGTKCVAMYGPTEPAVCGPYGEEHACVQAYLQQGSSKERRGDDNSAMAAITVEMLAHACSRILQRRAA